MTTDSLLFKHEINISESTAVAKKRRVLLDSISQIEETYKKVITKPEIPAPSCSQEDYEEALKLYNAVITDGRFAELMSNNPKAAADELNLSVSEGALLLVEKMTREVKDPKITPQGPLEAVIAVSVVVVTKRRPSVHLLERSIVIDSSANVSLKL